MANSLHAFTCVGYINDNNLMMHACFTSLYSIWMLSILVCTVVSVIFLCWLPLYIYYMDWLEVKVGKVMIFLVYNCQFTYIFDSDVEDVVFWLGK